MLHLWDFLQTSMVDTFNSENILIRKMYTRGIRATFNNPDCLKLFILVLDVASYWFLMELIMCYICWISSKYLW